MLKSERIKRKLMQTLFQSPHSIFKMSWGLLNPNLTLELNDLQAAWHVGITMLIKISIIWMQNSSDHYSKKETCIQQVKQNVFCLVLQWEISNTTDQLTTISHDTAFISNNNCLLSTIIQSLNYCASVSIIKGMTLIIGFDYSAWHRQRDSSSLAIIISNKSTLAWTEAVHFQFIMAAIHPISGMDRCEKITGFVRQSQRMAMCDLCAIL